MLEIAFVVAGSHLVVAEAGRGRVIESVVVRMLGSAVAKMAEVVGRRHCLPLAVYRCYERKDSCLVFEVVGC